MEEIKLTCQQCNGITKKKTRCINKIRTSEPVDKVFCRYHINPVSTEKKTVDPVLPGKKYVILDTETTGLYPQRIKHSKRTDSLFPHLVCLNYIILDSDYKELSPIKTVYVKPNNFKVINTHIHGMTTRLCNDHGSDLKKVIQEFMDEFDENTIFVGYGADFDKKVLELEAKRVGIKSSINKVHCIMKTIQDIIHDMYWVKLKDAYKLTCNKVINPLESHIGDYDLKIFLEIFLALNKKNIEFKDLFNHSVINDLI